LAGSLLRIAEEPAQAAEAAAVFERCAALEPDDADVRLAVVAAWVRAAELASAAEQVEAAQAHLQRAQAACSLAAERQPEAAEPWFRAGLIAERSGDPAAAIAAYEQALRRDGVHLGSLLNLAALLDAASDALARGLWQRVLSLDAERAVLRSGERQRIEAALAR
jgi:tetratricopeptide (TPR) repeat protein